MKRIRLTGMSGTGKSSVIRALADLGYKAIDTDDGWCEQLPDGRQRWREDAITALLATEDADVLFVAGCEENQVRFHPQFDHIILLSATITTMLQRLGAGPATLMARHLSTLTVSSATPGTSSLCYGRQPITRSQQPCHSTTSLQASCVSSASEPSALGTPLQTFASAVGRMLSRSGWFPDGGPTRRMSGGRTRPPRLASVWPIRREARESRCWQRLAAPELRSCPLPSGRICPAAGSIPRAAA